MIASVEQSIDLRNHKIPARQIALSVLKEEPYDFA
jgi:hypothetical protein